jgi:hypothetical protein
MEHNSNRKPEKTANKSSDRGINTTAQPISHTSDIIVETYTENQF